MQDIVIKDELRNTAPRVQINLEDKQKLVGAFSWLLTQDKKQNPAHYK